MLCMRLKLAHRAAVKAGSGDSRVCCDVHIYPESLSHIWCDAVAYLARFAASPAQSASKLTHPAAKVSCVKPWCSLNCLLGMSPCCMPASSCCLPGTSCSCKSAVKNHGSGAVQLPLPLPTSAQWLRIRLLMRAPLPCNMQQAGMQVKRFCYMHGAAGVGSLVSAPLPCDTQQAGAQANT